MQLTKKIKAIRNKCIARFREILEIKAFDDKPPIFQFVKIGLIILVVFIGGFLTWSIFADLESAAIANGKLIAETKNKTIKHIDGGIIEVIHVKDGDNIKQGDLLITLDDTKPRALLEVYQKQYLSLLAEEARLVAERNSSNKIEWPKALAAEPGLQSIQYSILKADQETLNGQLKILNKKIEQLNNEISSYQSRLEAGKEQLIYIKQELEMYKKLEKKKLIELPRLLEMKRKSANLVGTQGEYQGQIAQAQQKIGETKQQIITLKDNYIKDILKELKTVRDKLTDVKPKLESAADTVLHTSISSPIDGIIVGLTKFAKGSVVTPGEVLMKIFPSRDQLIAEARVNPSDIELVGIGNEARIYLTAYKQRNTPSLIGEVTYLSADVFQDEQTYQNYYKAYVKIPDGELKKIKNVQLYPGMQVRVMIITDKRSPMDYFLTPIKDSFRYAFRER